MVICVTQAPTRRTPSGGAAFIEFVIQGGERQSLALSEFKIDGIVEAQPVLPRERQHSGVVGQGRMIDRETFQDPKESETL